MKLAICHYSFNRVWAQEKWTADRLADEIKALGVEGIDYHARLIGPRENAAPAIRAALVRTGLAAPTFDDFVERFFYGWPSFESGSRTAWTPRVDIHETDDAYLLDLEIPGVPKDKVKVEVRNGTLTVSGERQPERKADKESYRLERHYGAFERTFSLGEAVDAARITAEYKDGVLTLTLPRAEKAKPREIAVEVK